MPSIENKHHVNSPSQEKYDSSEGSFGTTLWWMSYMYMNMAIFTIVYHRDVDTGMVVGPLL